MPTTTVKTKRDPCVQLPKRRCAAEVPGADLNVTVVSCQAIAPVVAAFKRHLIAVKRNRMRIVALDGWSVFLKQVNLQTITAKG